MSTVDRQLTRRNGSLPDLVTLLREQHACTAAGIAPLAAGNWGSMTRTRGMDGAALVIPPRLRRFVLAEWVKPGEESLPDRVLAARAAYTTARQLWAREHGFDVDAVNGTHPGADWWSFIALCAEQQREAS